MPIIITFIIYGLINSSLIMLAAVSFDQIYSSTKIFNLAHAGIYTLSAYILYSFYNLLGLNFALSLIFALLLSALFGVLLETLFFFPLEKRKAKHNAFIITGIGLYTIIINGVAFFYNNEPKVIFSGIRESYDIFGIILTKVLILQLIIPVIVIILYLMFLSKTGFGLKMQGLSDNPALLQILGINKRAVRAAVFFAASLLVSVSSILKALDVGFEPYSGMTLILNAVVAMILGGSGNIKGIIAGSYILGIIQSLVAYFSSNKYEPLITFSILIIILIFKPEGLFTRKRRAENRSSV